MCNMKKVFILRFYKDYIYGNSSHEMKVNAHQNGLLTFFILSSFVFHRKKNALQVWIRSTWVWVKWIRDTQCLYQYHIGSMWYELVWAGFNC